MKILTYKRDASANVDVHVLVHHGLAKPEWLEQCLESLRHEPVNVQLVSSADRNIGALRASAFALGTAPYLSFIDDDDWVASGAFEVCVSTLEDQPELVGAYTNWTDVLPSGEHRARELPPWTPLQGLTHYAGILHTKVFRREPTMRLLGGLATWETLEEAWLVGMLTANGAWKRLPINGHFKRAATPGGAGSRITSNLLHRYQLEVGPILRAAHSRYTTKDAA